MQAGEEDAEGLVELGGTATRLGRRTGLGESWLQDQTTREVTVVDWLTEQGVRAVFTATASPQPEQLRRTRQLLHARELLDGELFHTVLEVRAVIAE